MKNKAKWIRILNIIGTITFLAGTIDPLEGSVLILAGSMMLFTSAYLANDKYWKMLRMSTVLILFGVVAMFYLSYLGGFGGESSLSWWWGTLILPYPIGWIVNIVILFIRFIKKRVGLNNS